MKQYYREKLLRMQFSGDDYWDDFTVDSVSETSFPELLEENKETLNVYGYISKDLAKTREEKKLFENKYYLLDKNYGDVLEVVPENLSKNQAEQLAEKYQLVQVVKPKSVLSKESYELLKKARTKLERERETARKAKEARLAKKKQKELEKAQKILKEAGKL